FVIWVGGEPDAQVVRSLYLLRAGGFDAAFEKAVARAREDEGEGADSDGRAVSWLLAEIETLDCLDRRMGDGREVYFEPGGYRPVSDFVFPLRPELSKPVRAGL
ncbi:MAG: DUF4288 domain-containing protein, partial [Propionibacteriaceae bacterium]|nr:DUF4288 domain-containing protein [Propionibacteriaceae bacterium]